MISFIKQENTHANRFVIRWEVRKVQTKSAENMGKLVRGQGIEKKSVHLS